MHESLELARPQAGRHRRCSQRGGSTLAMRVVTTAGAGVACHGSWYGVVGTHIQPMHIYSCPARSACLPAQNYN
jgi:hypothetical protein